MKLASKTGRRFRWIRLAAFGVWRQSASPWRATSVALIRCMHPHAKQHAVLAAAAL
jgi:hypothetical protein